jgi:hypothetical protein
MMAQYLMLLFADNQVLLSDIENGLHRELHTTHSTTKQFEMKYPY